MFSSNTSQVSSGGYEIQRSLRFNSADSTGLTRTPGSASNRKTWTWSAWVKRSTPGENQILFASRPEAGVYFYLLLHAESNTFRVEGTTSTATVLITTQVFRDPSAWYHIVVAVDTTQATASNRIKVYVNGAQVTAFSTTNYPGENNDTNINTATQHTMGYQNLFGNHLNGYMTEVNFIDGQALTPSSFGAFDAQTGVWGPTRYAGSYGTNGFYLNFSDNSNTTAATLGRDYSGNSNNWTPNNFSVSAGAGNDSLVDVPTNFGVDTGVGGTVRGNYCTLNPIAGVFGSPNPISNGNLNMTVQSGAFNIGAAGTFLMPRSGKYYFEMTVDDGAQNTGGIGVGFGSATKSYGTGTDLTVGSWTLQNNGDVRANGTIVTTVATWSNNGDICGITIDYDLSEIKFYINNSLRATLSGANFPAVDVVPYFHNGARTINCNFGQRPFAYTAPSGFRALNTQNLPTPTIGATTATQAGKFFNPVVWAGDNSSTRTITGAGFQPDFVWMKNRTTPYSHLLYDVIRGASTGSVSAALSSNGTGAQGSVNDDSSNGYMSAFASDGFNVVKGSTSNSYTNASGSEYVAWNWKAGDSNVTNTAGSITSTVRANTTSGFSVVTYTGNGGGATVGHGLGAAPRMVIIKSRSAGGSSPSYNWVVYTTVTGSLGYLFLNTTAAINSLGAPGQASPTSSVFSLSTNNFENQNTVTYVAYCFAEVPGYSRFGSWTGNGSSDGPFVYCGFRPKYIIFKASSIDQAWGVVDTTRSPYNLVNLNISPNYSSAENSGYAKMDILSNGFKIRETDTFINSSGATYIFMAFAENPFKYSLAR